METVSRRTRGRLDAYYRNLHRTIKNPTNNKVEEKINNNIIDHDEVEDDVVVDSESESESDDEEQHKKKKKKKKKKTKTRLVGKKRVGGGAAGEIDFFSVLDIDIEREKKRKIKRENSSIIIGEDGDRGLALKFKFDDDDDDDEGKSSASCLVGEKSEIDRLFDDLELGLWESSEAPLSLSQSSHSHSDYSCATVLNDEEEYMQNDEEETVEEEEVEVEESRAGKCSRGEHLPYVDEEIGIICTSCLSLLLDIKYVLPPFCAEPSASASPSPSPSKLTPSSSFSSSSNIPSSFKQVKQVEGGGGRESGGGTVFDLIPPSDKDKDKDKELYPHQLEGFELLWRNIGGGIHLNNLPASNGGGSGCIISHAPGTGKTRLTIVFLQTFLKLYPTCRPLLIAPRGMLLTWHQELIKWNAPISFHNLNESTLSHEEETAISDQHYPYPKTLDYIRSIKIRSWIKGGSILGVAYRLFEELTRSHTFKKVLLESPTLLILDEGHTPRNDHTLMWKVLTKVTTQRRIILSGTPFQNNFDELFNTLSLVNPTFSQQLHTQTQTHIGGGEASCRKRGRRRKNNNNAAREEWANLTNSITTGRGRGSSRNDDEGIKKLRALIQPFVHVHKGNILQQTLPGIKDCLIILKPTPLQQKLLDHNVARLHNFLEQSHLASLISVHPSLVAQDPAFSHHKRKLKSLESDPKAGVKTHFLINLIDISSRINEKVLIFSEFIKPLLHIKKLLKSHFAYNEGRQVMYIDGDLSMKQRQSLITSFNDKNGEAKVLLASQRACCEGISLVGASRVVLLDVSWNPSVERQAICRAYRLGQEKMVYVYHLITLMEVKKYARQTEKDRISELIFSGAGAGEGEGEMRGCCRESVCQDKVLEAMVDRQGTMFERIVHQPKESDFIKDFGFGDLDFSTSMDFNDT